MNAVDASAKIAPEVLKKMDDREHFLLDCYDGRGFTFVDHGALGPHGSQRCSDPGVECAKNFI